MQTPFNGAISCEQYTWFQLSQKADIDKYLLSQPDGNKANLSHFVHDQYFKSMTH